MAADREDLSLSERIAALSPEKRALLRARLQARTATAAPQPIAPRGDAAPAPLSLGQFGIWLAERIRPGIGFNLLFSLRLMGPLELGALQKSLHRVVERHEILRTTFEVAGGDPVQIVHRAPNIALHIFDLSGLAADAREAQLGAIAVEASRVPFDLAAGPLVRWRLVRLDAELHVLLVVVHHLVFDDWSLGILAHELGAAYGAYASGREPRLDPPAIQYADFAVWQRAQTRERAYHRQIAYWRDKLRGAPAALELPADRRGPAKRTHCAARACATIPLDLVQSLQRLGRRQAATLYMTLLAGFKVLLSRLTGESDVLVATSLLDREQAETQELIGFLLKLLLLRTDLTGDPSFIEALRRVRETVLGAFSHAEVPYDRIVAEINPERGPGDGLFRVQFQLLPKPEPAFHAAPLRIEYDEVASGTATTDLDVMAWETDDGVKLAVQFSTELFDGSTIAHLIAAFQALLAAIAANPEQRISGLPLFSASERRRLLIGLNDTRRAIPRSNIAQEFEKQASRTPDAIALVADGGELSYRALEESANRLARALRARGIAGGSRVALCLERSVDYVISLLATLKTGAAYAPVDPGYPPARLVFVLHDVKPGIVVTSQAFLGLLDFVPEQRRFVLERERAFIESQDAEELPEQAAGAAYVIYTSGSTGAPNGIVGTHLGTLNRFAWMWSQFPYEPGEVACARISPSFVDHVWELLGPLLKGVPVVLAGTEEAHDPRGLTELLARHGCTRLTLVPSLLDSLLSSMPDLCARLPRLKLVVASGEELPGRVARRFHAKMPARTLVNLYGSSEVSADVTWQVVGDDHAPPPIGVPIWNTQVYVLDRYHEPVPVGVTAEICVSGFGLGLGYLNRPELTAERFVPDRFAQERERCPGARMYRTGDLGRWRADGTLEYAGRRGSQVKLRGYRIELAEIESVLRSHPYVAGAAAALRGDGSGDRRIVAYAVAKGGADVAPEALRAYASRILPDYMVPSSVVLTDTLPLTPSGKIDRRALPRIEREPRTAQTGTPRNALEAQLKALWEEVLETAPIGTKDGFFELGGNSLVAIRLFVEIEKRFGRSLPVTSLFEAPTVASLASVIREDGFAPRFSSLVPIQSGGTRPPLFLVPAHSGQLALLHRLARHLGAEHPLYGFQARGLDATEGPRTTIEEMATDYVEEMRSVQPQGPYFIGGHCFGATVAFEMAQQLHAAGDAVGLLLLLDAMPRAGFFRRSFGYYLRRSTYHLQRRPLQLARHISDRIRLARLRQGMMRHRQRLQSRVVDALVRVESAALNAGSVYVPRRYAGDITCIWSDELARLAEFEAAWRALCAGQVDSYRIPGTQLTLLEEPHVRALALRVQTCIMQGRARAANKTNHA